MPDNRFSCSSQLNSRDTVCIDANRVLDSCRDRDCHENVRVFLTDFGNEIIDRTSNIRVKSSCITGANIATDPIAFNRGFYSVDMRIYVKLTCEACVCSGRTQDFEGIAVLEKRVVLYGGESNLNVFRSSGDHDFCSVPENCISDNTPTAVLETVDPIVLSARVVENGGECCSCCCCCSDVPEVVTRTLNGTLTDASSTGRSLSVTIGMFSVVRLERSAQYLIQATEYSVPDKECITQSEDSPCSVFRNMAFPTQEFSLQTTPVINSSCGRNSDSNRDGCGRNNERSCN